MRVKLNIRQRMLFWVLSVSAMLYVVSMGYVLQQSRKQMLKDAIDNARLVAENSAQKMQIFFERDLALTRTLAQGLSVYHEMDSSVWQPLFAKIYRPVLEGNPHINTLWDSWEYYGYVPDYQKKYGRFCISVYREKNQITTQFDRRSLTGDPNLYGPFKERNREGIWEPYLDRVKKNELYLMTTVASPIQVNGKFMGIMGVDVTLANLQQQVEKIKPVEGSFAYLVSMGGIIAAHPDTASINKHINEIYPDEVKEQKLLEIISQGREHFYIRTDKHGNRYLTIFEPVKVGNSYSVWSLAYSFPMRLITEEVDRNFIFSLIIGVLGLSLLVLLIVFISNSLTKPIRQITHSLKVISRGEINSDLIIELKTGDEIEEMANALNQSIKGLDTKSEFAKSIGEGNYNTQLELLSETDVLGKSLIEMQHSLIKAREEEKLANQKIKRQRDNLSKLNKSLVAKNQEIEQAQMKLVQSEKMASLGVLTAGIAHEINNPINFVFAGSNCLARDFQDIKHVIDSIKIIEAQNIPSDEKIERIRQSMIECDYNEAVNAAEQTIKDIILGAIRATEIVEGLRSFSRGESSTWNSYDIHRAIEGVLILLKNKYKTHIEIIKDFDSTIPEIQTLGGKFNQVIMNLFSNAIDAIPDQGTIFVTTKRVGDKVTISVKDTGKGIPENIKPNIFDPFFTTKEVGKGTGLGLSISFAIVEEHHGTIEFISKESEGTEFIVTLPIRQPVDKKQSGIRQK
jgi:signal transduction histidine kinase